MALLFCWPLTEAFRVSYVLMNCVMPKPSEYGFTGDGALVLSTLVPKEVRKRVRASKDLRNAFVHYDFSGLLGMQVEVVSERQTAY